MKRKSKICNRCGIENRPNATSCKVCHSSRFAPAWVLAKRPVNRQVSVEITKSNPKYGSMQKRITLSKWWLGGRASFHIPNLAQWSKIEQIIEDELGPFLGWGKKRELIQRIKEQQEKKKDISDNVKNLVTDHPDFLKEVVSALDPEKLRKEDVGSILDIMKQLALAMTNADVGFAQSFISLIRKLPKQRKRALEELEELLGEWSLQQITSVTQQVKHRLETIQLFRKQIMDDRTYEISGDRSIHRVLEKAMWLIDERYWLMHSNESLRTFIGKEMTKKDRKKFGRKRPDFVCGMIGDKLVIVEIKRPSHELVIEDLNQLETYITLAEKYKSYRSCEGYLMGNKVDDDLKKRLKYRSSNFKVWTYSDLLDAAETRYSDYLKEIN